MIPTLTAENARTISKNDLVIFEEIVVLSREIINQSLDNKYDATVSAGTTMTTTQLYYQVWTGTATDRQISEQMNSVIQYFEKLGYIITRKTNTVSGNTIIWFVQW